MTTPPDPETEPSVGALPPLPTVGVTAKPIAQLPRQGEQSVTATDAEPVQGPITTAQAASRRALGPWLAAVVVIGVALVAVALAFRADDSSANQPLVVQEAQPIVLTTPTPTPLDSALERDGSAVVAFGAPALVADSTGEGAEVWEITVAAPRVATDEVTLGPNTGGPKPNHEFVGVTVTLKLVASADGSGFPPTEWLLEGDLPRQNIELPSIPDIEKCRLRNLFVSLPVKVGESMQGNFCVEVRVSDISENPIVRLELGGRRTRFGGAG